MEKNKKIVVENLTISFRTPQGLLHAVRGIDFDLYEGETLAIVGESGSGKSVSCRAIMGILAGNAIIDDGKIIYENQDLTKISEDNFHTIRGDKIGMIFQDPMSSLNPIMRIGNQIIEGMIINGNHYKNRYDKLIHSYKMAYENAKNEKKLLLDRFNFEKSRLKNSAEIIKLKNELKLKIAELNKKISLAKKDLVKQKPLVKKTVAKEFKEEKKQILTEIAAAKKDLVKQKPLVKKTVAKEFKEEEKQILAATAAAKKELSVQDTDEARKKLEELQKKLHRYKKVTREEAKEHALEIMKEVGIDNPERRFKQYPFQFSGGMRQRVVIAIALTTNPDILICDEPTTALDVTIQAQILELINKLKKERNLSVVFITHDLGVVANMADRVAVMYAGKIVEIGNVDEIFYNPKHPYTWALLASMPDLNSKDRLVAIPGTPPNMLFPPKGDAFADRNQYAMKIDYEKQPPFFKISETHYAATWLLHKDAPKVEMPKAIKDRIAAMSQTPKEVNNNGN